MQTQQPRQPSPHPIQPQATIGGQNNSNLHRRGSSQSGAPASPQNGGIAGAQSTAKTQPPQPSSMLSQNRGEAVGSVQSSGATAPRGSQHTSGQKHSSSSNIHKQQQRSSTAQSLPRQGSVSNRSSSVQRPTYAKASVVEAWVDFREPEDLDWVRRWVRITEDTFDLHLSLLDAIPQDTLNLRDLFVGTLGGRVFRISTGKEDFLEFLCSDDTEYDEFIAALLARCRREGEPIVEVDWKAMYEDLLAKYRALEAKNKEQAQIINDLEKELLRLNNLLADAKVREMELLEKLKNAEDKISRLMEENGHLQKGLAQRDKRIEELEKLLAELRRPKPKGQIGIQCTLFDPSQYKKTVPTADMGCQIGARHLSSTTQTILTGPVVSSEDVAPRPTCHILTQTQVTGPTMSSKAGNELAVFAELASKCGAFVKVLPELPVKSLDLVKIPFAELDHIVKSTEAIPKQLGPNGIAALPEKTRKLLAGAKAKVAEYSRLMAEREALLKKNQGRRPLDLLRVHEGLGWLEAGTTFVSLKSEKERGGDVNTSVDSDTSYSSLLANGTTCAGGLAPGQDASDLDPASKWRKLNRIFQHEMTSGGVGELHEDIGANDLSTLDLDLRASCELFQHRYNKLLKMTEYELDMLLKLSDWEKRCREAIRQVDAFREVICAEGLKNVTTERDLLLLDGSSDPLSLEDATKMYSEAVPELNQGVVRLVKEEPWPGHPLANILCTKVARMHADFYARTQRETRAFLRHHRSAESIARYALSLKRAAQIVDKIRGCEMFAVEFAAGWPIAGELVELPRRCIAEDMILSKLKDWMNMDLTTGRIRLSKANNLAEMAPAVVAPTEVYGSERPHRHNQPSTFRSRSNSVVSSVPLATGTAPPTRVSSPAVASLHPPPPATRRSSSVSSALSLGSSPPPRPVSGGEGDAALSTARKGSGGVMLHWTNKRGHDKVLNIPTTTISTTKVATQRSNSKPPRIF